MAEIIPPFQTEGTGIYFNGAIHLFVSPWAEPDIAAYTELLNAALAVARLNYDLPDAIRPRTNGATEAFHRLEDAARPFLSVEDCQSCSNCGVSRSVIGSHIKKCANCGDDAIYLGRESGA